MNRKGDKRKPDRDVKRPNDPERHKPTREEREQEKEHEFEFDLLRQHQERFDVKRWVSGMAQKRRMPQASLETLDPGPSVFEQKGVPAAFIGLHKDKVRLQASENPKPNGSFGFVGSHVTLEADQSFLQGILALRFDPKQLGPVVRHSLRLFFWDVRAKNFTLVHGSQVSFEGDYVFAAITRPGQYALIGVNADPLVLTTTRLLCAAGSFGSALPEIAQRLIEPICLVILCAPDLRQALENSNLRESLIRAGAEMGFPLPPGDFGSVADGGDLCDRCRGMGGLRLPECDIFDEPIPVAPRCPEDWESVGPRDLAGCIKHVHIDPTDPNRIYCAAMNGGIWVLDSVSAYPHVTWRPLSDQLDSLQMNAVAVAPSDSEVVYAASPYIRMYRSEDRGGNWRGLANTGGWKVHKILVHPADADTVYAATESGFSVSSNGGVDWTPLRSGDILDAVLDPLDSSIIYIAVRNEGVLKTVTSGFGPWNTVLPWSRAASPATETIKIAVGERQADGALQTDANRTVVAKFSLEIFVNRRGGRSAGGGWVSKGSMGITSQLWWDNVLAVDPFDPDVFLTGEQQLYRTPDGGDNWSTVASYYLPHEDQQSLEFDRVNRGVVYLSNDGGVFRSTDGGRTWYVEPFVVSAEISARRSLTKDLVTAEFYRVGVQYHAAVGNLYHSGIIGTTVLPSSHWDGIEGHAWEFANVYADPKRVGRFYVFGGELIRRRYPGLGSDDLVPFGTFRPNGALAVDERAGSNIILAAAAPDASGPATSNRLMMTTEGDREPRRLTDGSVTDQPAWTTAIDNGADAIVSAMFAPSEPARAYAMSSGGRVFRKDNIDTSGAWDQPGGWSVSGVRQMAVNLLHPERLYAITNNAFGRSIDGGMSWNPFGAASLPVSEFNSLVVDPRIANRLYLGADIGVFVSNNEGDTWFPYDAELPNAEVLEIFSNSGYLYAVTHGRGLWRRRLC